MDFAEATLVTKALRRTEGVRDALPVPGDKGNDWNVSVTTALEDTFTVHSVDEMNRLRDAISEGQI